MLLCMLDLVLLPLPSKRSIPPGHLQFLTSDTERLLSLPFRLNIDAGMYSLAPTWHHHAGNLNPGQKRSSHNTYLYIASTQPVVERMRGA